MSYLRPQLSNQKVLRIHSGIALGVIIVDQLTKALILFNLEPFESVRVTGFLNLFLVFNEGAAFGFLSGADFDVNRVFLYANLGILALLGYALWTLRPGRTQAATGIWLILGGAVGNLIDRVLHGHVVDFFDFHLGAWHYSTFNVADSAITLGAVLVAMEIFRIKILFRRG